jgi:hypothetical protein
MSLLGRVRRRLDIPDVVGEAAEDVDVPLGLADKRKKQSCQ